MSGRCEEKAFGEDLLFAKNTHFAEFLITQFRQIFSWDLLQLFQCFVDGLAEIFCCSVKITVSAAKRFWDHSVDHAKPEQIRAGQFQSGRGIRSREDR